MRKLPKEKLSWITIYEWADGDPRSKIPWDDKPLGATNRPLYELLENDRYLVVKVLDLLYSLKDIQTALNSFSKVHTDIVIKRSGLEIPGFQDGGVSGVIPINTHTDIDARVSSIGEFKREYRDKYGRCNYTDHGDFHEDIAHKDYPGHFDQYVDTTEHLDKTTSRTTIVNKPLWLARYLPPVDDNIYVALHADHQDSHLDISYVGNAPKRSYHADRSISTSETYFTYLPFWNQEHLNRYLTSGELDPNFYTRIQNPGHRVYHYDSDVLKDSPREFRTSTHGDHQDVESPVVVVISSTGNQGKSNPYYGMYHSVNLEELSGGLSQILTETISHQDKVYHQDYHQDSGFGFHGDLNHYDNHFDFLEHCDFTDPHTDYISHSDYKYIDITTPQPSHANYTDHANILHGDSYQLLPNECVHTDTPHIHGDLPERPHQDSVVHADFWEGSEPSPHVDYLGGTQYHSDFTLSPPFHADHIDYGSLIEWGGILDKTLGIIRIGDEEVYNNPHYDLYSKNNHSDVLVEVPPGSYHIDFPYQEAEYSYSHTDFLRHADYTKNPKLLLLQRPNYTDHGDETYHGDKPEIRYVAMGRTHGDVPGNTSAPVHGDSVVYQDQPYSPHKDYSDHGDGVHCDYGTYSGHTDVHNDYPHQDHDDHANTAYSGTYNQHQDIPHLDHYDHGDI